MAVHGSVRRALLYGAVVGVLAVAATASVAGVKVPSGAASTAATAHAKSVAIAKARVQRAHGAQFCRWFPHHGLCVPYVSQWRFCDRRPSHLLCAQAADNGFCQKRPDHPLCDDDRFCRKRPHHPLCGDEPPPSPS
jgi:hypothetical protein